MDGDFHGAVDRLLAAVTDLQTAPIDDLPHRQLLAELDRIKHAVWAVPSVEHRLTGRLIAEADPHRLGATSLREVLANHLRITQKDATQRLTDATQLGPRYTLTGERVQNDLAHTADAVARGDIGVAHVRIIQDFVKRLPTWVSFARRDDYEHDLVTHAQTLVPEDFRKVAETLLAHIDQDGAEPDYPTQQRRRTVTVGRQQADGMSHLDGWIDPEFRAFLDVVLAKHAAPGANLPHHDTHHDHDTHDAAHDDTHDDTHDAARTGRDHRTAGQRHHDAIKTVLRDTVASGRLGQVAGVPATIVASTTLSELEHAAGWAHTGGGNRLPLRDLIRMAATSRHYLAVFDDHTEEILYLGRAKRTATTAQRLALFARDKGCTHPHCTAPFYWTQAHHAHDYRTGGRTDIDNLTLACQPANLMIDKTGWTTHRPGNGRTHWNPPKHHDTGQPRLNHHFHPHRYLSAKDDDEPE
ncbi:hypothetical protein MDOR_20350 [Mycolicibacterium doricum]|uniref:HNH nuclease domain-containing protein n=1 Tax=Mycolicibacterium doricum TaxID=126673 RepID=A0A7I7VRD8_9MYCO|nr:HNH endonuclease signature motif containing protein [Mycolicibacterium doricum]BBZ07866.1 hypothetical protein MDOR_20350 [Mycolicibacterium doricum]